MNFCVLACCTLVLLRKCVCQTYVSVSQHTNVDKRGIILGSTLFAIACEPSIYRMDHPELILCRFMEHFIDMKMVQKVNFSLR